MIRPDHPSHPVRHRRALTAGLAGVAGLGLTLAGVAGTVGVTAASAAPTVHPNIARGASVPDGTYPWAVSLHLGSTPTRGNLNCSGEHIAAQYVLTAAHCFDENLNGTIAGSGEHRATAYWVSLNRTRISTTGRGEVIRGAAVYLNPHNDIAVLKLARPSSAPVVALATAAPGPGTAVTAAGWGYTDTRSQNIPDNLQRAPFVTTGNHSSVDLTYRPLHTAELCGGDSGGPVFTQSGGAVTLVAVHTNSPSGCGIHTGVATGSRVDVALPWIRSIARPMYGFVWANSPTSSSYAPSSSYSYNSSGATNTITRSAVGAYTVTLPGLGVAAGDVQVTAYGSTDHRCKVASWGPLGTAERVNVRCFDTAGDPADSYFDAQFFVAGAGTAQQQAYVWASNPTLSSYVAPPQYSYNSRGTVTTVTRTGVGAYTVGLPRFTTVGGNIAVTAYGSDSSQCKIYYWAPAGAYVRCYTAAGGPTDTRFTLRYTDQQTANGGQRSAYVWADDPTSNTYLPSSTYAFHSAGAGITISRFGVGYYRVDIASIASYTVSSVMVTGYGGSTSNCVSAGWGSDGAGGVDAYVQCATPGGTAVDSQFTLSYLTS